VVKYAPGGGVAISMREEDKGILMSICDQGPGIPEEERERVFELFHRLDSRDSREVYGHGLGLTVAKRFLEAMDGWIRISINESEGVGTCVRFWVPAVE
jgi:signal transduction histidine kinase